MINQTIFPTSDRHVTGAGWVLTGGATHWDVVSDADYASFDSHSGAIGRISLGLTAGDFLADGTTIKCRRLRLVVQTLTTDFKAGLAEEDAGANDIPYDLIDGTTDSRTFLGFVSVFHSSWLTPPGDDWSPAELATKSIYYESDGLAQIYEMHVEVDNVYMPLNTITSPTVTEECSPYHTFRWRFTPGSLDDDDTDVQKKFRVKVFDKGYVDGLGGAFVIETDLNTIADSGIVNGATNHYTFAEMEGGRLTSPIPYEDNMFYVYVKVATDVNGADFWGDWTRLKFHVPNPPVVSLLTPATFSTASPGAVGATWIETSGFPGNQIGYEFRIYLLEDLPDPEYFVQGVGRPHDPDDADKDGVPWAYRAIREGDSTEELIDRDTRIVPGFAIAYLRIREGLFGQWSGWDDNAFYIIGGAVDPVATNLWISQDATRGQTHIAIEAAKHTSTIGTPEEFMIQRRVGSGPYETIRRAVVGDGYVVNGVRTIGSSGSGIQATDNNYYNVNLDFIVRARLDDWTPASIQTLGSIWRTTGNARSWKFQVTTAGNLQLVWSTNGTAEATAVSTVTLPLSTAPFNVPGGDPVWLRVQFDDTANTFKFFYSTSQLTHESLLNGQFPRADIVWTQLGATVSPGATNIFNAGALTGTFEVGASNNLVDERAIGNFYEAAVLNGLGLAAVISFQAYDVDPHATTHTDSAGNVLTFVGGAGGTVGPIGRLDYVDQEAPLNEPYNYRFLTYAIGASGLREAGVEETSPQLNYMVKDKCFLQDLDDPDNSRHFPVADKWLQRTHRQRRTEHWPIGKDAPVFSRTQASAAAFNVTLTVQGDDIEALMAMIDEAHQMAFLTPKRLWKVDVSGDVSLRDHIWDLYHSEEDIEQITLPLQEVSS